MIMQVADTLSLQLGYPQMVTGEFFPQVRASFYVSVSKWSLFHGSKGVLRKAPLLSYLWGGGRVLRENGYRK